MKSNSLALGLICLSTLSFAAQTKGPKPQPQTPPLGAGFVQAPSFGNSQDLNLDQLPVNIRQSAEVALAGYGKAKITSAHIDLDDVVAIYEVDAMSADGRHIEVDVEASGKIEEIEIQLKAEEVPAAIMDEMNKRAPDFQPTTEEVKIEKSLRPSRNGLIEVWYEFGGVNYDVEVRSDAKAVLIEPA